MTGYENTHHIGATGYTSMRDNTATIDVDPDLFMRGATAVGVQSNAMPSSNAFHTSSFRTRPQRTGFDPVPPGALTHRPAEAPTL